MFLKTEGVRISDSKESVLSVRLSDVLEEISEGKNLHWSILFLDGILNQNQGLTLLEIENKINHSKNGLPIQWAELWELSDKFSQIFEVVILGSTNPEFLHRYSSDQEMYNTCDIVIELIDCAFWEVYSRDKSLMEKFRIKFKEVEVM